MHEWPILTLREAGIQLFDCVHKTPPAQETGYPYVGIPQMKGGRIDFDSARRISREDFIEWTKKTKPQRHDVILSRRTNPGVTASDSTDTDFALGQNLVLLRADGHRVEPAFLKWLVQTPAWWHQIEKFINVGAVFDSLRCADVPNFELTIPPLDVQRQVGVLLDALENKIDINRRTNETLEAMARAIFEDWFVDFGPSRIKAEGRAPYLASELWGLFPDTLDEEDKPVGWKIGSISDLADTNQHSWTARSHPPVVEYVDLSNAKWGNIDTITTLAWEDAPSRARRIAKAGDTIVGTTRPGNGSFAYISQDGLTVSTGFAVLSPREAVYSDVVHIAATRPDNIDRLANLADGHGGAYPAVKPSEVSDTELVLPGATIFTAFAELVSPLRAKVECAKAENRSLAQTCDLLLPKLMSGEIRLRDAEKEVEAVA
jgi:type I restriction enzyme S subunit